MSERDIHRIGRANVENLRLKPREKALNPPGISVLKCATAHEAAEQVRAALPNARRLHEDAKVISSTTEELIRSVGFDLIEAPSVTLPNHYRIIHPDEPAGFRDENLARLAQVFVETTEPSA
jgi:hypothetical protein